MSQNKQTFVKKAGFAEARATKKVAKIRAEKKAMTKKKDYSSLLENPEIKAFFEKDEAAIKKVGATFESLPLEMRMAFESILNGHSSGCILEGPTGAGTSFAINIMANKASAPLLGVQVTEGTTIDDLVGSYVLDGEGGFKFIEGPLLKAYSSGFWVKIDGVNLGNAGVLSVINQFGDGTSRLTFGGKTYHLNPNFVMFLTMNPGYEGTTILNVSLKNRFCKVDVSEGATPKRHLRDVKPRNHRPRSLEAQGRQETGGPWGHIYEDYVLENFKLFLRRRSQQE